MNWGGVQAQRRQNVFIFEERKVRNSNGVMEERDLIKVEDRGAIQEENVLDIGFGLEISGTLS